MLDAVNIKHLASEVGFDLCGITSVCNFNAERLFFDSWLRRGYNAGLRYMERNVEKRFSPSLLMPDVESIIVCGVAYRNDSSIQPDGCRDGMPTPKVASYARTRDYHSSIKEMLFELAGRLCDEYGDISFRAFTDSAPVLEKKLALEAGLGFIGRNKLLISPDVGSFVLLGELFINKKVDVYDSPRVTIGCAGCNRCVDACPNGALTSDGIDAGRCIARLTIEKIDENISSSSTALTMGGWVFGCDVCQGVCPYNTSAPEYRNSRFEPLFDPREISVSDWEGMTNDEFKCRFSGTPLERAGYERVRELALQMKR